jgi:hypothetical protein
MKNHKQLICKKNSHGCYHYLLRVLLAPSKKVILAIPLRYQALLSQLHIFHLEKSSTKIYKKKVEKKVRMPYAKYFSTLDYKISV